VVSKVLYLRERYRFGPSRIASYVQRFHHLAVARSTVHRILIHQGMNRLPANQNPGGQVKVLHLWPGQTPPADAMGRGIITH
jgi:hypothetical protein